MRSVRWVCFALAVCVPSAALGQGGAADEWLTRPVDNAVYRSYLDFFTYDRSVPFDLEVLGTEAVEGASREHLAFTSTPGQRVYAHLYRPTVGGRDTLPAIVLLHGGGGAGKNGMGRFAEVLARSGWLVLAIDMLHYGERRTDLFETGTLQERYERLYNATSTYLSWIIQTVKDVQRSVDLLVRERGADPQQISLFGLSRGAQAGFFAGAVEQRFRAVVAHYGGHILSEGTGHLAPACPANYIGRISPRALLMVNGERDALFRADESVRPLQRLAGAPHDLIWLDNGHVQMSMEEFGDVIAWLREHGRT